MMHYFSLLHFYPRKLRHPYSTPWCPRHHQNHKESRGQADVHRGTLHWPLPTTQITHHLSFTQDKQQRAHIYLFFLTINIAQQLTRSPDQLPLEWYFYQVSSTILSSTPDPSNSVFTWKDPAQYRKTALYGILFLPERVRLQMTAGPINGFAYTFYVPWYRYYTQPPLTSKCFLQDDL